MKAKVKPKPKKKLTPAQKIACAEVILGGLHTYVGNFLDQSINKAEILRRLSLAIGVLEGEV